MPEVIHGDVSGGSFFVWPLEIASVMADVDSFCFGASCGGGYSTNLGKVDRRK
jgi:hypothetical protein